MIASKRAPPRNKHREENCSYSRVNSTMRSQRVHEPHAALNFSFANATAGLLLLPNNIPVNAVHQRMGGVRAPAAAQVRIAVKRLGRSPRDQLDEPCPLGVKRKLSDVL
jgi:hypothetical protein